MAVRVSEPDLKRTVDIAEGYLASLPTRPVGARASFEELYGALSGPLPEGGEDPSSVVQQLATTVEPGLMATTGPRYFGFVIGGVLPAALSADWLTTVWDQNAGLCVASPAAAAVEEVVADWVKSLLGFSAAASVGLVTGCQMANFAGLAAGRHAVLSRAGWDVESEGLNGAPEVHVVVGEEAHATLFSALRLLGLGAGSAKRVAVDGQGRMRADALAEVLASLNGPTLVSAQAGNVNTGAFDPLEEIATLSHEHGAWLHVDGAFGAWAAAAPERRQLACGLERADSLATDAHKWLNVPYDSGIVLVADSQAHRAAFSKTAAYLMPAPGAARDGYLYTPDSSRRARAFPLYAALKSLGRQGVADLVERLCVLAQRMAERLAADERLELLNEVTLNQVLVRFSPRDASTGEERDAFTRAVIERIQAGDTLWAGGTRWQDKEALRLSLSCWSTTEADVDRSADAILEATREVEASWT